MPIQLVCYDCGAKYRVEEQRAGGVFRCKHCGGDVGMPGSRRSPPKARGVPWLVWAGVGGGAAVLLLAGGVVAVVILLGLLRRGAGEPGPRASQPPPGAQPKRPAAPPAQATPPDDPKAVADRLRAMERRGEEERRRREEEFARLQRINDWSIRLTKVYGRRQTAFPPLTGPLQDAMLKAALRASDAGDRAAFRRLQDERSALGQDGLNVPRSPEVRDLAVAYAEKRLELERGFVRELNDLKASKPEGVHANDERLLAEQLSAAEAGVRRLQAAATELAAAPVPGTPRGTDVAANARPPKPPAAGGRPPEAGNPGKTERDFLGPPPPSWAVTADPPRERPDFPATLPYQTLDAPTVDMLTYPPGLTAYVAVGSGPGRVEAYVVRDLRSGKAVGLVGGLEVRTEPLAVGGPALSSDGTYLAVFDSTRKAVLVGNVKTRKGAGAFPFDDTRVALLFPAPDRLLAVPTSSKVPAMLWQLPAGKLMPSFPVVQDPTPETGRIACSPGGRYLAVASEESQPRNVTFYDLTTGKKAGVLKAPGRNRNLQPWFIAMAFSPDGTEFAAFLGGVTVGLNVGETMACWDVKTGRLVYQRVLEGSGALNILSPEPLQWFPDGKGWLLFQQYVIDREAGRVAEVVSAGSDIYAHHGTKVLDDRRLLVSAGGGKMKPVEVRRSLGRKGP